ncbi:hypothetical protein M422DRAFT_260357 [Sphaerobolus stellatus SS14]|uniref:Uncharacterized protein n=1 Tax=Sphaerobolus stellatus (strain SS14) TaxID=990650 RepID=A0A0C9VI39_SPHS4|nr:hypothetical protein M422DRAFT_260357 [Sphaerobolus stellatus SS14]
MLRDLPCDAKANAKGAAPYALSLWLVLWILPNITGSSVPYNVIKFGLDLTPHDEKQRRIYFVNIPMYCKTHDVESSQMDVAGSPSAIQYATSGAAMNWPSFLCRADDPAPAEHQQYLHTKPRRPFAFGILWITMCGQVEKYLLEQHHVPLEYTNPPLTVLPIDATCLPYLVALSEFASFSGALSYVQATGVCPLEQVVIKYGYSARRQHFGTITTK